MYRISVVLLFSLFLVGHAAAQEPLRAAGPAAVLVAPDVVTAASRPVWSPDGQWLAFAGGENGDLWIAEGDGSNPRELSSEMGAGYAPVWSPDGMALLTRASRYEDGRRLTAVRVFDVAAGTSRQLTDYRPSMPTLPRWSADGTEALLMNGNEVERLATGRAAVQGKAPTGGAVVLAGDRRLTRVEPTGTVATLPVRFERPLLNVIPSPDGARVAFEVFGGNLFVVDSDGSNLVDLGPGNRPSWSPDGAWIAYQRASDDGHRYTVSDLYAVRPDGSERVRLTDSAQRLEMSPAWRPDGRALAFEAVDDAALYVLPLAR